MSNVLAWLADAKLAEGRLDQAIALRREQIAFLDRLAGSSSTDVTFRQSLIPARRALGLLYAWRGRTELGIEQYRLALAEANRLIPIEPDNSLWKDLAAGVRLDLAQALLRAGRDGEAAEETAAGCNLAAGLRSRDPNVAGWGRLQTSCLEARARLALASGDNAQALGFAERALNAARSERSGDPIADRYRVAAAFRLLGDARRRAGDGKGASAAWAAGLADLPANVVERPWEISERAELLRRAGRTEGARPLLERLGRIGYKASA